MKKTMFSLIVMIAAISLAHAADNQTIAEKYPHLHRVKATSSLPGITYVVQTIPFSMVCQAEGNAYEVTHPDAATADKSETKTLMSNPLLATMHAIATKYPNSVKEMEVKIEQEYANGQPTGGWYVAGGAYPIYPEDAK